MEKKTQLYFKDDNKFVFRKMELSYSCLLEKKGDKIVRAWRHSYGGQYDFPGYKNMTADTVTLGFARDIFLDPHKKIPTTDDISGKPTKAKDKIALWIAAIATIQRQIYRSQKKGNSTADYINLALIAVIILEIIGWLIRFGQGG